MTATTRPQRRRRLLLVTAALLASLEVGGSVLASAAMARAALAQRAAGAVTQPVALQVPSALHIPPTRPASAWPRLAAELPRSDEATGSRTRSRLTSDQAFDASLDEAPAPAAEEAAPPPSVPATAGVETTAAAGGLAGASRTAAVVAQRLRIPDLGINRTIQQYPCSRSEPPENYVYRWGCAGRDNLYLLGHAETVFKALHDAYAAGRLRVGTAAQFTDSTGRTVTYRVTTWRVVRPDEVSWAIASQPVPSMTLQTCYGANSEYRLLVRLVAS